MKNFPWVKTLRRENGLIEHVCKHGVGHPAIGSVQWLELAGGQGMGIHGCDGCCRHPDWKLTDAIEGSRIANRHAYNLVFHNRQLEKQIIELESKIPSPRKRSRNVVKRPRA